MMNVAFGILEFIVIFLLLYIIHKLAFKKSFKNLTTYPINVRYMMIRYKIDVKKIGYKKVFDELCMCDSFIVAVLFSVTRMIDNVIIRLVVCFVLMFPLFFGIYHIMAKHYRRKDDK